MKKNHLKVVVVGDVAVGKTALIDCFINDHYPATNHSTTIGAYCGNRHLLNKHNVPVLMTIWDTSGAERFRSLTRQYYRGSDAAILCFDLTLLNSLQNLNYWIDDLQNTEPGCKLYLCGCKKDLVESFLDDQSFDDSLIQKFATNLNMKYFETTFKDKKGIVDLFQTIANDLSEHLKLKSKINLRSIKLENNVNKKSVSTCKNC